ncbi:hypothetical protein [Brevundimonas sp.]|uniref:hypothetical protein n=1 Tax=Brevundimonas sp. TaxID=1871086 RepID=UPI0028AF8C8D|nr:hypothetical protein [Brevundimonas sp.]
MAIFLSASQFVSETNLRKPGVSALIVADYFRSLAQKSAVALRNPQVLLILCGVAPRKIESIPRADVLVQETRVKPITDVERYEIDDPAEPYRVVMWCPPPGSPEDGSELGAKAALLSWLRSQQFGVT